jgi:predicted nucleic acid-binding Zn ribbon protein
MKKTEKAVPIRAAIEQLLARKSWQGHVMASRVSLEWPQIVGPEIAARTRPERLAHGRLYIVCEHDVWRTELQYLKPEILQRVAEVLGEGVVKDVYLR